MKADIKRKIRFKLKTVINGEFYKISDFIDYSIDCIFNEITPVNKLIEINS